MENHSENVARKISKKYGYIPTADEQRQIASRAYGVYFVFQTILHESRFFPVPGQLSTKLFCAYRQSKRVGVLAENTTCIVQLYCMFSKDKQQTKSECTGLLFARIICSAFRQVLHAFDGSERLHLYLIGDLKIIIIIINTIKIDTVNEREIPFK